MKISKILLAAVSVMMVGGVAQAQKLGTAGCGLGNMVFGAEPGLIQVVAATLNGTGVQTFGITTGTSNCDEGGNSAQIMNFIDNNKIALSKDAARGEGETISGLAKLVNCKDSQSLGLSMKSNYESIFPSQEVSPAKITIEVQRLLQDQRLAIACGRVG
jgi:hypothetical protein